MWLLNRAGGEAQELTNVTGGVSEFDWSPDGKRLVLVARDANPDDEPEKKDGWKRKTTPPIVIDRYHFKQDREGYLRALHSHLWLFEMDTRKAEPLTTGEFNEQSPAWSPDGRFIAFVSNRTTDPDRNNNSNIYVIEARNGAQPRQLTSYAGSDGGEPSWSPDGKWIAYLQGDETKYSAYSMNKLAIVPAAEEGQPRLLTASLDRPVSGNIVWTSDSQQLMFVVADDRISYVGKIAASGGRVEMLTTGLRVVSNISRRNDGAMAVLSTTTTEPDEVYALENGAMRRLTHQNDELFRNLELGTTENFTSKSKDGTEVHGVLAKPASFAAGQKYPMILYIHGGPNGQDAHSFNFDRQLFAAHGYVVISVNYRGSAGRGSEYQKAIFADWGNREVIDLIGAVDHMIASGVADPDRLGIGGWSYGGILTDYTIATDSRFKAAFSGAGSALQTSMYGLDQYIRQYDNEIGPPWKAQDQWIRISYPFFHADRIKTPTLFLGGEKDFNVPVAGGEQMYQVLRSLGVETQLVIYPGQYHTLTTPSYQRDRLERYLGWFDKYLK